MPHAGGLCNGRREAYRGHSLAARYVIHTVGPVWQGGTRGEAALLASCYRRSLEVAAAHGVRTIAFPAISCGAYGYPVDEATAIAVATARDFLNAHELPSAVTFVCFGEEVYRAYRRLIPDGDERSA